MARGEELERSRDPGALVAHRHPHGAARRPGRFTEPLPGSGGQWRPRRLALRPEREPPSRSPVRLQARLDGASDRPRGRASRQRRAGGARGRFQRRGDGARHLQDEVLGSRRPAATRKPRVLPAPPGSGLDGRRSRASTGRADVHVLGLQAPPLGARRRPPARPHPRQSRSDGSTSGRRRGPGRPRKSGRQRSRSGLGRAWRGDPRRPRPASPAPPIVEGGGRRSD